MIRTYRQFVDEEYRALRAEYPDAAPADLREMVEGPSRRQDWVDEVTKAMREGTPTPQQWIVLKHELGTDYIARRVFHDEPASAGRYLAAGLYLRYLKEGKP